MIKKKKVAAICRKHKQLRLATTADGTQWIGPSSGTLYIMAGMPRMTIDEALSAFDYSEKDVENMSVSEINKIDKYLADYLGFGAIYDSDFIFCPHCGAKIDGKDGEQ